MIDIEKVREAVREVCQSSHCVSDSLRKELKPYQVTEHKNVIMDALTELDRLQKKEQGIKPVELQLVDDEPSTSICQCGREVYSFENYCSHCGFALDWSDEK